MLLSRPFPLEQNRLPVIVAEFATSSIRPTRHPSMQDEVFSLNPTLSCYLYSLYYLEGVFSETGLPVFGVLGNPYAAGPRHMR